MRFLVRPIAKRAPGVGHVYQVCPIWADIAKDKKKNEKQSGPPTPSTKTHYLSLERRPQARLSGSAGAGKRPQARASGSAGAEG